MTAVERTIQWRKANPERWKANQRNFRKGATYKAHRRANTAIQNRYWSRYVARLGEGYIRKLLREGENNPNPTTEQIEGCRRRIRLMRSLRLMGILSYGH